MLRRVKCHVGSYKWVYTLHKPKNLSYFDPAEIKDYHLRKKYYNSIFLRLGILSEGIKSTFIQYSNKVVSKKITSYNNRQTGIGD